LNASLPDGAEAFAAEISFYDFSKYVYTCVYFPDEITARLPMTEFPRLRIHATIDDVRTSGAMMPDRVGSPQTKHLLAEGYDEGARIWYLQVPKRVLAEIDKEIGDEVQVSFLVADQDEVETHPSVEEMLNADAALATTWRSLTPGKRRTLMHPILAARTEPTLEKRLLVFEESLRDLGFE
jgi:hypothetical protein